MSESLPTEGLDENLDPETDKPDKKRLKKLQKSLEMGLLDPWERYRALTDLLRQHMVLVEVADRKTRFALVLIGAINAINLIVLVRPELLLGTRTLNKAFVSIYLILYVGLTLFLFFHAIQELKPRIWGSIRDLGVPEDEMRGLRFFGDTMRIGRTEYYEKWQSVQFSQLNREIAYNIQLVAKALSAKYQALDSLFNGILVLILLTAGLLFFLIFTQGWL